MMHIVHQFIDYNFSMATGDVKKSMWSYWSCLILKD